MEYSIGEFAALMNVTVKTLHHYEKLGLLNPARVDQFTGYRKYSSVQFETMMQIRQHQHLGLPLAAIKRIISGEVDDDSYEAILENRKDSLRDRITKDLQTYGALAATLGIEDELSGFAEMYSAMHTIVCDRVPPPMLSGCLRPMPPHVEDSGFTHGPRSALLSVSVPLASRSVGNLRQATKALAEKLLPETKAEEAKDQIWYWIETMDDPEEGTLFRMHAGIEASEEISIAPGAVKTNLPDFQISFTGHDFRAFGSGAWRQMTNHMHHEMYEQGVLPTGPLFVRLGENSDYPGESLAFQGGVRDDSIRRSFDGVDDLDDEDEPANPFDHWYSDMEL
ncbi:MerR family transcriptional regulator [Glutamicibacter sp. AOP38-B1-38]|uniref:MerR family transcriptional regulator n=1 Tax=Glutamicibacter sp. AOP38-B1-38 TaxID=3457680 RepID=UPI004034B3A5